MQRGREYCCFDLVSEGAVAWAEFAVGDTEDDALVHAWRRYTRKSRGTATAVRGDRSRAHVAARMRAIAGSPAPEPLAIEQSARRPLETTISDRGPTRETWIRRTSRRRPSSGCRRADSYRVRYPETNR